MRYIISFFIPFVLSFLAGMGVAAAFVAARLSDERCEDNEDSEG